MSNLLRLLAVSTLLLLGTSITAQELPNNNNHQNVIPPPPTDAGLGKYGYFPVSLYTGLPNISIPLFELKDKNLTVPITLSYHASGIKVDEIAGWVGLGWSLNAGGIITRNVIGNPDESANGYWSQAANIPNPNNNLLFQQLYFAANGIYDLEPDSYSFNFMGFSGSFYVDPFDLNNDYVRECYIFPHANITIKYDGQNFIATDYNGVVYKFEKRNLVTSVQSGGQPKVYPSTWYLTEVFDPNTKAKISFNYTQVNEYYDYNNTYSEAEMECESLFTNKERRKIGRTSSQNSSKSYYLESIICNDQIVEFKKGTAIREDMLQGSGCSLKSIELGKVGTPKRIAYNFKYEYFYANPYSSTAEFNKRLKLQSLTKVGENGEEGGTYELDYNGGLPARGSYSHDYWGFINGKTNTTPLPPYWGLQGADLEPDASGVKMQAGTLRKIKFPTGGSTEFFYEPHDYSFYVNGNITPVTSGERRTGVFIVNLNGTPYEESIYLYRNQFVTFKVIFDPRFFEVIITNENGGTTSIDETQEEQSLWMASGTYKIKIVRCCGVPGPDVPPTVISRADLQVGYTVESNTQIALSGGLRIKKIVNNPINGEPTTKTYEYRLSSDNAKSSGIRCKFLPVYHRIDHVLYETGTQGTVDEVWRTRVSVNQYTYGLTSGSTVGYSEVKEVDEYSNAKQEIERNGCTWYKFSNFFDIQDDYYNLYSTLGKNYDFCSTAWTRPIVEEIFDDFDYLRGRLISKIVYNSKEHPILKEDYEYTPPRTTYRIPGIRSGIVYQRSSSLDADIDLNQVGFIEYFKTIKESDLDSTTEKLYTGSNNNEWPYSTLITKYLYNSNHQVVEEMVYQPPTCPLCNTTSIKKEISYADIGGSIQAYIPDYNVDILNEMVNRNMLGIPIFRKVLKNGITTEKSVNRFYTNNSEIHLKYKEEYDFDKQSFYKTFSFNHSNGNIVDSQKDGDLNEAYYWGYNNRYPVAKFVNMNYSVIQNRIELKTELEKLSSYTVLSDPMICLQLKSINEEIRRQAPADALVYTYTFDFSGRMTSSTDPNNLTTYYDYDGLGRLRFIRDDKGNVLKRYDYNYSNP